MGIQVQPLIEPCLTKNRSSFKFNVMPHNTPTYGGVVFHSSGEPFKTSKLQS